MRAHFARVVICLTIALVGIAYSQDSTAASGAHQLATIIGIETQVSELQDRQAHGRVPDVQMLALRQDLYMAVFAASLDVDSVLAEIDNESAQLSEMQARLQSRRDRGLNITTIGNIVAGGGSGIIGTAMQLNDNTAMLGDQIGLASSGASTALQIYSLHQQHGARAPVGRIPNMLARFFDRPEVLQSHYPDSVWKYLNAAPVTAQETRRQALISGWIRDGRIGLVTAPSSQPKISQLTGSMNQVSLSIDIIADRLAMLADVRGRVSLMKRDLAELIRSGSLRP